MKQSECEGLRWLDDSTRRPFYDLSGLDEHALGPLLVELDWCDIENGVRELEP